MADLNIQSKTLNETFLNIENDINEISEILNNIYNAMLSFDETTWKGKEKEKIDSEYLPYLKKIVEIVPTVLTKHLTFSKNALKTYEELDNKLSQKITGETEVL